MKISEITAADIWRHIRESPEDMETEDNTEILVMKKAAVEFCKKQKDIIFQRQGIDCRTAFDREK